MKKQIRKFVDKDVDRWREGSLLARFADFPHLKTGLATFLMITPTKCVDPKDEKNLFDLGKKRYLISFKNPDRKKKSQFLKDESKNPD